MANQYLLNEDAITSETQDVFNFNYYAKKVNLIIQKNSANPNPLTIGIYGKWGEGKTSFLNLLNDYLSAFESSDTNKRILRYSFNPWRYSTEEEMLFDFFEGLSKTLMINENQILKKAGKYILKFSRYLKAIKLSASIGIPTNNNTITFEPNEIFQALGEDLIGKDITLDKIKEKIDSVLENCDYKIAIFIDDLDRLDKDEIYTLLKIVKLNGNFKNLIYIIALDPEQVSKAIHGRYGNDIKDGKSFLEKIINIPIILPKIEKEDLQLFFDKNIANLNKTLNLNRDNDFKDIVFEFRQFNFNTPRQIIRVINSFSISAFAIGEEVNLRDLFWIEYLKITNETCYNEIKNYNEETHFFSEMSGIVDFNDDSNRKEKPNGFRKYLIETYPTVESILKHLFPADTSQTFGSILDPKILEKELRINSAEHFEKYFSYHTLRKMSETKIKDIKKLISEGNNDELKIAIRDLFSRHAEYKTLYKIEGLIEDLMHEDLPFFCSFLISNLELIPDIGEDMFGRSFRIRIIEKIAIRLNENENQIDYIVDLGEKMSLFNLCYFTRKFSIENLKDKLHDIIIAKTKILNEPFYIEPLHAPNKMIMQIWKNKNPEEFNTFIKNTLQKDNILQLIRNFPGFWNNAFFGALTKSNYDFMKSVLDVDFVYNKLREYYPELFDDKIDLLDIESNETDEHTIERNAQQFIYWYNKEKLILLLD